MKKLFLVASCLFLSDSCVGCDNMSDKMKEAISEQSKLAYQKSIKEHSLQAAVVDEVYESYMLRDETTFGRAIRFQAYMNRNIKPQPEDCPIIDTPPTSPRK